MASVAEYITAQKLINFLGWISGGSILTLTTSTIPTLEIVEERISEAEEEVEKKTRRNWRTTYKTVSNEHHSWSYSQQSTIRKGIYANVITIDLFFMNIVDFASGTDKIEIWNGSAWIDLVATETKGTALFDGAYFCDLKTGRLYLHSNFPSQGMDNIRITYRYGEYVNSPTTDIPSDLRRAVMQLAGADLNETYGSLFQYQIEDSRGSGNYGFNAKTWRERAKAAIDEYRLEKAFNLFS